MIGYYGIDGGLGLTRFSASSEAAINQGFESVENDVRAISVHANGFLGLRYHFSPQFSLSAETSLRARYRNEHIEQIFGDFPAEEISTNSFSLATRPLHALRFAFHF
ncbi:hypothetical protein A3SI_18096 [Nitritalea halalkaliphila LW7]|uniref:Outer membrane protein beta-barrel domain-containing protein n=1 Tax=Nitritalea halalkaliphila LW7 TaxID=1189621 RepID=I5BUU8_9BACT|nr:hypothetical protein [Nitritalea halalkaliphila]EIM73350.1 hypothetical protein A3SI_18096 [Nitritalea halalkaliphila LW7]